MSDIVSPLLEWLNAHPQLAGLITFIISAGESVAILGTIVPGSIMMTALGTLAGAKIIPLWETIFWAIMGAMVGDGISYWIGHYFKNRLPQIWPFRNHPNLLLYGENFFHKYGSMSVFIGRFVGPVRALVPLVAGMLGMKPLQFTIANIASAILWAPAYMLPGILLGAAAQELPPDIAIHVILALLMMILFSMLCLWFIYKIYQLIDIQLNQLQNIIWHHLKNSRYFSSATHVLKHHDPKKTHGQFNLALVFIATCLVFFALAFLIKVKGPAHFGINDAVYHLFRGLSVKNDKLDQIIIGLTLLGQKQVLLPLVLALCVWLMFIKRFRLALHILTLTFATIGSIFIFKHLLQIPRPWGIAGNPETYSMPSGHTTLATVFFIGISLLINQSFSRPYRWPFYTIAILLTLIVGFTRLYLGAHWFSDIISSWFLGTALLIFISISYQRKKEMPVNPWGLILISILTLFITFNFYLSHMDNLKLQYKQVALPHTLVKNHDWWFKNDMLPAYRVSLFGFPSQPINVEWAGHIEEIHKTLLKEGWKKPPARNFISTLHRISDVSSTEYLPLISPQYLDKNPRLILTRLANDKKSLLTIRLWDSNCVLEESKTPIWVGMVSVIPRSYSWIYKKNPGAVKISINIIFPYTMEPNVWVWKKATPNKLAHELNEAQKIILIKNHLIK